MNRFVCWLPRVLSFLLIAFVSVFALDVFGGEMWFLALMIHLIPSFILSILLVVAWRRKRLGGSLFVVVGLLSLLFFGTPIIMVPMVIIGVLFWVSSLRCWFCFEAKK